MRAVTQVEHVTLGQAIGIGIGQVLSLIPGVSRAGATILTGLVVGLDRKAATEFSFFLALPTMYAACLFALWKSRHTLDLAAALGAGGRLRDRLRERAGRDPRASCASCRRTRCARSGGTGSPPAWRVLALARAGALTVSAALRARGRRGARRAVRTPPSDAAARSTSRARRVAGVAIWQRAPPCTETDDLRRAVDERRPGVARRAADAGEERVGQAGQRLAAPATVDARVLQARALRVALEVDDRSRDRAAAARCRAARRRPAARAAGAT